MAKRIIVSITSENAGNGSSTVAQLFAAFCLQHGFYTNLVMSEHPVRSVEQHATIVKGMVEQHTQIDILDEVHEGASQYTYRYWDPHLPLPVNGIDEMDFGQAQAMVASSIGEFSPPSEA